MQRLIREDGTTYREVAKGTRLSHVTVWGAAAGSRRVSAAAGLRILDWFGGRLKPKDLPMDEGERELLRRLRPKRSRCRAESAA